MSDQAGELADQLPAGDLYPQVPGSPAVADCIAGQFMEGKSDVGGHADRDGAGVPFRAGYPACCGRTPDPELAPPSVPAWRTCCGTACGARACRHISDMCGTALPGCVYRVCRRGHPRMEQFARVASACLPRLADPPAGRPGCRALCVGSEAAARQASCRRVPAALMAGLNRVWCCVACLLSLSGVWRAVPGLSRGPGGGAAGPARRLTAEESAAGGARGRGGRRCGRPGGGCCLARCVAVIGRGAERSREVPAGGLPGGGRRRQR